MSVGRFNLPTTPVGSLNSAVGRLNLTNTDSYTEPVQVPPGATKVSVDIIHNDTSFTWGVAVATLQDTFENRDDGEGESMTNWASYSPSTTFVTATRRRRAIGATGTGWLRLKCSTVDTGADDKAKVVWRFS